MRATIEISIESDGSIYWIASKAFTLCFAPIYFNGNHVNMLFLIDKLESFFFEKEWRKAACESIGVDNTYVTKNRPSQKFQDDILAILKGKETQNWKIS